MTGTKEDTQGKITVSGHTIEVGEETDPYDDDWGIYDPKDDCDCLEAELDILEGVERCHVCGRSRFLNSEEFSRRLKQEAEWAEAYHEAMEAEEKA